MTPELWGRVQQIEVLLLDVDGVLTDGSIVYDSAGVEIKRFHVRDGAGIRLWELAGKRTGVLSGRTSPAVRVRAGELGIEPILEGYSQKLPGLRAFLQHLNVQPEQVAAMGDDLPDLPVLRNCGVALAPADACPEVLEDADYVTQAAGGRGAVREAIEWLLQAQSHWTERVAAYRAERLGGPNGDPAVREGGS